MKTSKAFQIIKGGATVVASLGVGLIIGNAVQMTTPANLSLIKKGLVSVGSVVLSGMVADKASDYTSKSVDELAEFLDAGTDEDAPVVVNAVVV